MVGRGMLIFAAIVCFVLGCLLGYIAALPGNQEANQLAIQQKNQQAIQQAIQHRIQQIACPNVTTATTAATPVLTTEVQAPQMARDCQLTHLVPLLNSLNFDAMESVSRRSDSSTSFAAEFLSQLTPWIVADPEHELRVNVRPQPIELNCASSKYSNVLSGKRLDQPRIIIDIVPMGYDLEILEVRFLETFDYVDVFIVFESAVNHQGGEKPLYFNMVRNTPRFLRFASKILYVQLDPAIEARLLASFTVSSTDDWSIEGQQRIYPIDYMKQHKDHPLLAQAFSNLNRAFVIQNDMDEIITGHAIYHFKHCDTLSSAAYPMLTGAISYKKTFEWLQTTSDANCMRGGNVGEAEDLKSHIWLAGPTILTLPQVLERGNTQRYHEVGKCTNHLGLGSAFHLSSTAEPASEWLKHASVMGERLTDDVGSAFLTAGKAHQITPALVVTDAIRPWCRSGYIMKHIGTMSAGALKILNENVPWSVRNNPSRFCFMLPDSTSAIAVAADPNWVKSC
eukprot:c10827_g1_i1.p1 GENE.c10827_g1_i1~~c10827_g1_i1.p1  ORF type:complete len:559 (-),score=93.49 c10827_g1_i1:44-1570(-)